jgi:hypothetical protein
MAGPSKDARNKEVDLVKAVLASGLVRKGATIDEVASLALGHALEEDSYVICWSRYCVVVKDDVPPPPPPEGPAI